jgi:hypothetical protein
MEQSSSMRRIAWAVSSIVIFVAILLLFLGDYSLARESSHWPTTSGLVIESKWVDTEGFGEQTRVKYDYTVEGHQFTSYKQSFNQCLMSFLPGCKEYDKDEIVTVYYLPGNPQTAVLQPGAQWFLFNVVLLSAVLSFVLPAVAYCVLSWIARRRRRGYQS